MESLFIGILGGILLTLLVVLVISLANERVLREVFEQQVADRGAAMFELSIRLDLHQWALSGLVTHLEDIGQDENRLGSAMTAAKSAVEAHNRMMRGER